jgi:ubiquinone biosynthesis protein UbiJ
MLLERLESILNRNVAESRRAQALARQLDGRVMSLTVEGTPLAFFFRAEGGRLAITSRHDGAADASLSGTPIALLALAGPKAEGALRKALIIGTICLSYGLIATGLFALIRLAL